MGSSSILCLDEVCRKKDGGSPHPELASQAVVLTPVAECWLLWSYDDGLPDLDGSGHGVDVRHRAGAAVVGQGLRVARAGLAAAAATRGLPALRRGQ